MIEYSKTYRWFLLIPGAHAIWLPIGLGFVIPGLLDSRAGMTRGSALTLGTIFCAIGLVAVIVTVALVVALRRRDRRNRRLRDHGLRTLGVVGACVPSAVRINGRQLVRMTVTAPAVPGLRFAQLFVSALPPGSSLTVAHDPARPGQGVVLDDVEELASRPAAMSPEDLLLSRLDRLEELRTLGTIGEDEFARLKSRIM